MNTDQFIIAGFVAAPTCHGTFWKGGRLKTMKNVLSWIPLVAAVTLLPACAVAPPSTSSPAATSPLPAQVSPLPQTPMSENNAATSPAARASIAALANQLNIVETGVRVLSMEEVDWTDGCLGLGRPDESCLQAIVSGYRVLLEANGRQFEARTDRDAQQVRIAPDGIPLATAVITSTAPQVDPNLIAPTEVPTSTSVEVPLNSPAVQAAVAALATQLSMDAQSIKVVSVEEVEWPDGCLGLAKPDQMCTQVIVAGYRVMLEASGVQYEARTSLNGRQVMIAPQR